MNLLTDQVCIVSGAGQGLGRAVALEMAGEGAKVVLLERNPDTVGRVATEISHHGGHAEPYELDVTDYDAYGAVIADVFGKFGKIDALVNNAAINPPSRTILEDNLDDWRQTIQINLEAVYMGSKLVAPGFMSTPMSIVRGVNETETPEFIELYVNKGKIPLRRTGYPEDVSGTVIFLASEYCRYMTGQLLVVDGGL